MNIFYTSECPDESANNLDSKRVNKMLLESCQMLSTAVNECGGKAPYKSTHTNHPSNVWVRQSKANYSWLWRHAQALSHIYTQETGKIHKCDAILNELSEPRHFNVIPNGDLTPMANCAANLTKGVSFKHIADTAEAYRQYLSARWDSDTLIPKWGYRPTPTFYTGKYA